MNRGQDVKGRLAALASIALFAAGCASIEVEAERLDADPLRPDGERSATYAWTDEPERLPPGARARTDPVVDDAVRAAVEAELAARGLHRTSREDADLLVGRTLGVEVRTRSEDPYSDLVHTAERYEQDVLTIELLEPGTLRPVWRGAGRIRLRVVARAYGLFASRWVETSERPEWRAKELARAVLGELAPAERPAASPASEPAPAS